MLDQQKSLRAAEEWRARRKPKKAIAELRRILEVEPRNPVAHARLGPLLLSTGDPKGAVPSLRIAASDLEARGFADKAVSLQLQLAAIDPTDVWAWQTASRLHHGRGRVAEAVKVLLLGASRQKGAPGRERSVRLLRDAQALAPDDSEVLLGLARRVRRDEARTLLDRALAKTSGPAHRKARWVDLRLFPSLGAFWRWLRA